MINGPEDLQFHLEGEFIQFTPDSGVERKVVTVKEAYEIADSKVPKVYAPYAITPMPTTGATSVSQPCKGIKSSNTQHSKLGF